MAEALNNSNSFSSLDSTGPETPTASIITYVFHYIIAI